MADVRCSWRRRVAGGGSRMRRWSSDAIDHLAVTPQLAPPRRTARAPHIAGIVWLALAGALILMTQEL